MKITPFDDTRAQALQQYQRADQNPSGAARRTLEDPGPQEQVDLSNQAMEFQQVRTVLTGQPEVREDRVAEVRQRLDAGTYQVDPGNIADRMVGESLLDIFG